MAQDLSYGDHLQRDRTLSSRAPRSGEHDELPFIVIHQASELGMRLSVHELAAAREQVRRDDLGYGGHISPVSPRLALSSSSA